MTDRSDKRRVNGIANRTAVVTGANHPTGLGAGRGLHLAGARVIGLARPYELSAAPIPSCRSRVWQPLHTLDADSPRDWIGGLLKLGETLDEPAFLMPTQDQLVLDLSRRRRELEAAYRFKLPPHDIIETFMDKTRFFDWAGNFDLPLPASRIVNNDDELRAALADMPFPLVLKPLYRTAEWNRKSPIDKAIRLEHPQDMRRIRFDLFAAAPAFILSQWIDGPDDAVHYCLAYCRSPGRMQAAVTGRKLLQYPRQTGSTAICTSTNNGEVRELAEEVFGRANFEGIGSLEVKYDDAGKPWITEPTVGRPNLQSYSAVLSGCNLYAHAMSHALGEEYSPPTHIRKCWWIEEHASMQLITAPSELSVPWKLLLGEALRARRRGAAYWTWWDPAVGFELYGQKVQRLFEKLLQRCKRILQKQPAS